MANALVKKLTLSALAAGLRAPENAVSRFQELSHLKRLLTALRIDCVFDVGANRGQFASELRGIGYRGRIISFEPQSAEFVALRGQFESDADWRGYQLALGVDEGSAKLNVFPDCSVLSSLREPGYRPATMLIETVRVARLESMLEDSLAELQDARLFLKMDTQGFDLDVFRGAGRFTSRILGLQSELLVSDVAFYSGMPRYLEGLAAYEEAGFRLFDMNTVCRTDAGALQEVNCLMYRVGSIVTA